jgi:predicted transcriptional regulator YdeE
MALIPKIFGTIILTLAVMSQSAIGENTLAPKIIEKLDGFTVIGISVRSNNAKEQSPDGNIGKQWQRFMQQGLLSKIPYKADSNIIAVYTDYASDKDGEYTFVLGAKVSSDKDVPAGMVAIKVPSGRYAMFTSEKGPAYRVVPELWRRIWAMPKASSGGDRAYKTDFEVYDQRAMDPQNAQVDIYIGIK